MEKDRYPEVGEVPEAPSTRFYKLDFRVVSFCHCVRYSMLKVITDVLIVPLYRPGRLNYRLQSAVGGPEVPTFIEPLRRLRIGEPPESAELLLHRKGTAHFQILILQLPKFPFLVSAPILSACQPKVFGPRQRLISVRFQFPMFLLANLV